MKISKRIIKALNRNVLKLQKHKNILLNKMVDLLSDKQFKEIMTAIKHKANIFRNKLQKTNAGNFSKTKHQIIDIRKKKEKKIRRNKKEIKIRKKKELAQIKKNIPNQNAINRIDIELSQHQQSLLKKCPSFVPTRKDELV